MSTSVGMKARKKQSSLSDNTYGRAFEQSLLNLENACMRILESSFSGSRHDPDYAYWQQRFKNIATPVSLALAEYKGPRRFHYHYRHRADDETILHPVLEPTPIDMLALVCKDALICCRTDLVGLQDHAFLEARDLLEHALQRFLIRYRNHKKN